MPWFFKILCGKYVILSVHRQETRKTNGYIYAVWFYLLHKYAVFSSHFITVSKD